MHFYFDDTSTSAISTYSHTLSLHGALPIAALVSELRGLQVDTGSILYGGERLGIYFLETGSVSRASKVIYDRAHSSISTIEPGMIDWDKTLDGVQWFHWPGITPDISQGAAEVCLEGIQTRSDERRVGQECVSTCRSRWSPDL